MKRFQILRPSLFSMPDVTSQFFIFQPGLNIHFNPWGGNPMQDHGDQFAFNSVVKDPLIFRSKDWDFPHGRHFNAEWLDRIHRGTPWKTTYLGSGLTYRLSLLRQRDWTAWSGHEPGNRSHPLQDWGLMDMLHDLDLFEEDTSLPPSSPRFINNTMLSQPGTLLPWESAHPAIYAARNTRPTFINNIIHSHETGIWLHETSDATLVSNGFAGNGVAVMDDSGSHEDLPPGNTIIPQPFMEHSGWETYLVGPEKDLLIF